MRQDRDGPSIKSPGQPIRGLKTPAGITGRFIINILAVVAASSAGLARHIYFAALSYLEMIPPAENTLARAPPATTRASRELLFNAFDVPRDSIERAIGHNDQC